MESYIINIINIISKESYNLLIFSISKLKKLIYKLKLICYKTIIKLIN